MLDNCRRTVRSRYKDSDICSNFLEHTKCRDCYEPGHFDKRYYKCKYYKAVNADDGKQ
ncbi:hypothetical protein BDF20DRAFT_883615 [Mycotypha africana]|uniref:uncharacterized protein n=1 Tax=Mycotypha africana TaxID=64632 RepID=UPI0022FFF231|nr:uncharacterized protein BDF20DRAFT_883615 [Mycotypha africana]KAI8973688.1 hypothetical protein BDF20DRAFT_883615 [Mycotypha africana]